MSYRYIAQTNANSYSQNAVDSALDTHADNPGSNPDENALFVQTLRALIPPSVDILGYQRRVHIITCLCGIGCKRILVLEMEDRVSVD